MHVLLALRKYQAAKEVFQRIPPDSVEVVTRTCRSKVLILVVAAYMYMYM